MRNMTIGKYILPGFMKPNNKEIHADWQWIVLCEEETKMLLLSRDIIDWDFYSGENTLFSPPIPSTWEKSYMRDLLAGLYETCFEPADKDRILTNGAGDHLFILTAKETRKYLPKASLRTAEIQWDDMSRDRYCWWLNTYGYNSSMMQIVTEAGTIDTEGRDNDSDEIGIRPAMWVRRLP